MKSLVLLSPEIFLATMGLLVLVGEAFLGARRKLWVGVTMLSLLAVGATLLCFFSHHALPFASSFGLAPVVKGGWVSYEPVLKMMAVDSLGAYFKLAILASVLIVLWLSVDYPDFAEVSMGTYCALLLLATAGMFILVSSTDLILSVIALELVGVPSFVLAGYLYQRRASSEAAMKYFLVGSLSTGILLLGVSYYYGYFGTTSLQPLLDYQRGGQVVDFSLSAILVLLVSGVGFKLSMVPFHMWAPDTYEGAPTPVTAFLSTAPKAATIGFLVRLLSHHVSLGFTPVLAMLAAITMTVGNIGALPQTNVKRLLAYSTIAQMGYVLVALVGGELLGIQAVLVYTFVYIFMDLGVFTILLAVANQSKSDEIETFAGLSKKSFPLALLLLVFLLSLTGIPPLAGFIGKFQVFASLISHKSLLWLGIVAVINSVISLYYYFKIAQQMFFRDPSGAPSARLSPALFASLVVTAFVTIAVGILPNSLLTWVRNLVGS